MNKNEVIWGRQGKWATYQQYEGDTMSWFDRIDKEGNSYFSRLQTLRVLNGGGQLNAMSHGGSATKLNMLVHPDDRHIIHYWGSEEIDRHAAYFS